MKKAIVLMMIPMLILCACTGAGYGQSSGGVRTVVDQAGRSVEINDPVERIVSGYYISSSACIALGLTGRMVGIEARADTRPIYALAAPELLALPNVGTAREFNLEACIALEPDLVIMPKQLRDRADILADMGVAVILVDPEGYNELQEMIMLIGDATGVREHAERLLAYYAQMRTAIDIMTAQITERPIVYMGGTGSYLSTVQRDMYQSALISLAGGQNAANDIGGSSRTEISYEQLLTMHPDVIVIPPEASYSKNDVFNDVQLASLSAVRDGRVYQMPDAFEAWDSPVPSGVLGILWLLHVLHGDIYSIDELRNDVSAFYHEFYGIQIDISLVGK